MLAYILFFSPGHRYMILTSYYVLCVCVMSVIICLRCYKYFLRVYYGCMLTDTSSCRTDFLTIATTRPETLFGDVAIAVHPEVG